MGTLSLSPPVRPSVRRPSVRTRDGSDQDLGYLAETRGANRLRIRHVTLPWLHSPLEAPPPLFPSSSHLSRIITHQAYHSRSILAALYRPGTGLSTRTRARVPCHARSPQFLVKRNNLWFEILLHGSLLHDRFLTSIDDALVTNVLHRKLQT